MYIFRVICSSLPIRTITIWVQVWFLPCMVCYWLVGVLPAKYTYQQFQQSNIILFRSQNPSLAPE